MGVFGCFPSGIFGRSYLAEQNGSKVVASFTQSGTESEQEAKILMRIESELHLHPELAPYSPYIVRGKADGIHQGRYYIFTEYTNGGVCHYLFFLFAFSGLFRIQSLDALTQPDLKPLPVHIAAIVIRQLCMDLII